MRMASSKLWPRETFTATNTVFGGNPSARCGKSAPMTVGLKKTTYPPEGLKSNAASTVLLPTSIAPAALTSSRRFMTGIICPSAPCGKQGNRGQP